MSRPMLQHLGRVARAARKQAQLRQIDIATTADVAHTSISRFELAESWPLDPDHVVAAYAEEIGVDPRDIWRAALDDWRDDDAG